jgi:hypothetical protein
MSLDLFANGRKRRPHGGECRESISQRFRCRRELFDEFQASPF